MSPKPSSLFRQEALDHKRDTWLGEILLARPTSFSILSVAFLGIAFALLAFLVWGEYTKKARSSGYLVPDQGLLKIFAQQSGAVSALRVREGQLVKRGDVLAVISTERTSESGDTQAEISKQLTMRRMSLVGEQVKTRQMYAEQLNSATKRLGNLSQEREQLTRTIQAQEQRVRLGEELVARNVRLATAGFVSDMTLQEKQADLIDQQNRLRDLQRARISIERDYLSLETDLRVLPLKERNDLAATDRAISEIASTGMENEARRESYVVAPQDGMVTALQADTGRQASPNQPLMSLIPAGTHLQADLYVPSRSVGFIRVGNFAQLQYQAFPYQKFGSQPGRVVKISRTAVPAQELPFPASPADVYYVITILPDQGHVLAYGKKEELQAGMQVDADVWLDKRTLLEWILEPLYSISGRL
ncbi:HlyD family secretion protein [Caenimonas terrae]|uniref:HlyD family secretion protein n=1 Tax=Caenimonas terrae TaxID=696074 RepID=A0ABW0NI83_9BURK